MLSTVVTDNIVIKSGILHINNNPIPRFAIENELGRGANGIVFSAQRVWLEQPCALKIWLRLKPGDARDKVQQGLAEARKMATSHPYWVVSLYDADLIGNVFITSMELINGEILKSYLQRQLSMVERFWLAKMYLSAIRATTTDQIAHGDAHHGNVIVYELNNSRHRELSLKLIDFGTSIFTEHDNFMERHWRVVDNTFKKILTGFKTINIAYKTLLKENDNINEIEENLKLAFYSDLLDAIRFELNPDEVSLTLGST